ncbi:Tim44 domain-containing protein [Vibrio diabolicus]|jgi:predicted lipid-binding transport protein (Tim44 family)|uniref:Preprotein translocase subunit Tim44 n=3 Tax=Vibrio TaxID=662 RepID=A0A2L2K398_9VIBR|nr:MULTISPECIES: Tim44 domain-containing protein [Vibrio]KOY46944.1 preprotein translocase subunit Tim44 [Vibrio parahaemolyticus]MCR9568112.1 Tim44 domain-containing protein [Vibrio alginolyticus]MEA3480956.1 Tim44 domain-containing protein [Pseudomonadota bacterium]AVH26594.1 preprotein translocase subunit Tim44 [Vibrio diabolicus]KAB0316462.1 Tim44 domain-containing protein [Vibrio diabolicus]
MKRLFSIVALLMFTVAVTPIAEAKKFGGSKSFGKSYKTAPAPKQQQQNTNTVGKDQTAKSSSKKGLMGGLLGGLLAGGLLAAFFGGAFEGIQFMDILIIGLIAFVIFKLMRGMLGAKQGSMNQHRQQPAFGGNASKFEQPNMQNFEQQPNTNNGGFGGFGAQTDVPHNYPPGFDQAAFINGSREHYRILQGAWNHNQLETIEEYVSPSLFEDLKAERAKLDGEQHTDVMYVDAEIVRADYDANKAQLSLQFSGRYRDTVEGVEEEIEDIWHLERDLTVPNAPWLIVGIQG